MNDGESAQILEQALCLVTLMGNNVEDGSINAIMAAAEVVRTYASYEDYKTIFGEELLQQMGIAPTGDEKVKNGVEGVPTMTGTFHVSGMQTLMKEQEALANMKSLILPLCNDPGFGKYIKKGF